MSLDVVDTIKSTFGRFKTGTGLSVLGLTLGLGLIGLGFSFLLPEMIMMGELGVVLAGLAALGLAAVGLVATVGMLRSLDMDSFELQNFTSNVRRPVLSYIGAAIVIGVFGFIALLIAGFAVGLLALLFAQLGVLMSMTSIYEAISAAIMGLFVLYPLLALSISVPRIAINDERMFESLDTSVLRTSGEKTAMFLASLPVLALYVVNRLAAMEMMPSAQMAGTTGQMPAQSLSSLITPELVPALVAVAVGSVVTTSLYSFLVELNQRLPE